MPQGPQAGVRTVTLVFRRRTPPDSKDERDAWRAHHRRVHWKLLARVVFIAAPSLDTVAVRVTDFPNMIWARDAVGIHEGAPTGPIVEGEVWPLFDETY